MYIHNIAEFIAGDLGTREISHNLIVRGSKTDIE